MKLILYIIKEKAGLKKPMGKHFLRMDYMDGFVNGYREECRNLLKISIV